MLPSVNDMLYILPSSSQDRIEYKARVSELDEEHIWIEIPLQEKTGKYGLFPEGEMIEVTFNTQDGTKGLFLTKVSGKRDDGIRMLSILKPNPDHVSKMQRRSFLRVDAKLEVAVRTENGTRIVVHSEDISGGGASIIVENKWALQQGQHLECWAVIPQKNEELEYITFVAEIVRVQERNDKYSVIMLKFTDIQETAQQKIVRFCFDRQLQIHKGEI